MLNPITCHQLNISLLRYLETGTPLPAADEKAIGLGEADTIISFLPRGRSPSIRTSGTYPIDIVFYLREV